MSNNQGIAHYGGKRGAFCGNQRAHIVVRDVNQFDREQKQCAKCAAKLSRLREQQQKAILTD